MAARLTDRQKKKIIADYMAVESYNAVAKMNGVSKDTVKRIIQNCENFAQKAQQKKEDNTADILAYMESQRGMVCEIIGKGLTVLNDEEKLKEATPAQITTAIGTLIDKWTAISGGPADTAKEDDLSRSLRELGKELESDE
ncbi:Uncharacterised protein [uncultured Clostridium sp.]|nr:Uncharacterised protein [uncultured Clostridium sp.]